MTRVSSSLTRRCFHALSASMLVLPTLAWAQGGAAAWPSKAVTVIVPFSPGGGTDAIARLVGLKLAASLKQPFIIDNRVGASGMIGTTAVAKAPPDGYTITVGLSTSLLINQFLYAKMPYDAQKDLAMVYRLAAGTQILAVKPSLPVKNGTELLAYIKANKGKLSYGSYGAGSTPHLFGAYLNHITNGEMNHVPYKGEAPMNQDFLGGQIDMAWVSAAAAKQHILAGKMKPIGVNATERMKALPDVPTLKESGITDPVFQMEGWLAVAVPAKVPKEIQDKLAAEIRKAMQDPEVQRKIEEMGFRPVLNSNPETFTAEYKQQLPKWAELVKISGAKLD
ncbi:MAG: tripartite tricarboxylate transporter substrate binding protein [Ottowia sp.]|nr:tripartite tricarboxylate transporter substrate binding protein [Ottowia sp.]MBK6747506.1 tripartite tricarboxylate transporter substrate binding protein [Ottowia sp.]